MTLEIKMPIDDSLVEFEVPENTIGLSLKFSSDKITTFNYLLYDDKGNLRGQNMGYAREGSIWLGPSKALSSAYSMPHNGSKTYGISYVITSSSGFETTETRGEITFYIDRDEYIEDYLAQDYVTPVHRWINDHGEFIIDYNRIPENKKDMKNTWFKGDFHSHTVFSDGSGTREDANYAALSNGLDFFFPTDHLIFPLEWPKSEDVLIMPSSEITTMFGHFNYYFGVSPYTQEPPKNQAKERNVINLLKNTEGFLTLNHPYRGREKFVLHDLPIEILDGIEIINSPLSTISDRANIRSSQLWSRLWNMGYDLVGRGGSDSHVKLQRYDQEKEGNVRIGKPTTYVLAEELSGNAIKKGLEEGFVSFAERGRPELSFTDNEINGEYAGKNAVGEKVALDEVELTFDLVDYDQEGLSYEWIVDGKIYSLEEGKSSTKSFSSENASWIRVDIRDGERRFLGSINPIRIKESKKYGQTLQDVIDGTPKVKAIIFDKDGTIIEFTDLWNRGTAEYIDELEASLKEKTAAKLAAGINDDGTIEPGSPLASGTIEDITRAIEESVSVNVSQEALEGKYSEYIEKYPEELTPRTDLVKLFEEIRKKDIKVGIVTSDGYELTLQQLEALGIKDYIDFTYGGDMLEAKPSPAILMDIEEKYGIGLDEMIYVGDSDTDMRFGSYTQKAVAIKSDVSSQEISLLADLVIDDLEEVLDLL